MIEMLKDERCFISPFARRWEEGGPEGNQPLWCAKSAKRNPERNILRHFPGRFNPARPTPQLRK